MGFQKRGLKWSLSRKKQERRNKVLRAQEVDNNEVVLTIKTTAQEEVSDNEEVIINVNVTEGDPPTHPPSHFQDKFKAEQCDEQHKQSENSKLFKFNAAQLSHATSSLSSKTT